MDLFEFLGFPRATQIEVLWDLGVSIGEREDERYLYVLYSLHSFYIELQYYGDALILIRGFKHTELLEPYLADIQIPAILHK